MKFNGYQASHAREAALLRKVGILQEQGINLKIAAILFTEDAGSVLYTRLKREAAERVGIEYVAFEFSVKTPVTEIVNKIVQLNADQSVTGIIIQKPSRALWLVATGQEKSEFKTWWLALVSALDEAKDVDGLHPATLAAIKAGTWEQQSKVLPATCKAVLSILESEALLKPASKIIILGKSDILGLPLYYELLNRHMDVEMIGSQELAERSEAGIFLRDADVIISATGRAGLITGDLIKEGVAVIDVGEPKGDVDAPSVTEKASFLTPVPGGVGPMTVISLLENCVQIAS